MLMNPYAAYGQQGESRCVTDLPRICRWRLAAPRLHNGV